MDACSKDLERLNSKHEKRSQVPDLTKATRTSWRGLLDEYWTPRRSTLAIVSLFALAGCFAFTTSVPAPSSYDSFADVDNGVPFNTSSKPHASSEYTASSPTMSELASALRLQRALAPSVPGPPGCNENDAPLRVYMYDLPPEFHYGMLDSSNLSQGQIWPEKIPPYPGGLYQQHSPEYWLTNDLLTSTMPDRQAECTAYRVDDWRFADVIYVPFFASLSYNKHLAGGSRREQVLGSRHQDRVLQKKLVEYLEKQPAWRASGGVDHVIVIHHPNSFLTARESLRNAMYVVADFGRTASAIANLDKDVVAPYKHVVTDFPDDDTSFHGRKTLLFFQGAIKRKEGGYIRKQLYNLLRKEKGVFFKPGNTTSGAIHSATSSMRASKFCLNLAGDTPSSNRLFDSIASHCVPVVISDHIELPFEDFLDYSTFCVFVKVRDALRPGFVIDLLRSVSEDRWTAMWSRLREVDRHFRYQFPTQRDDAVHMTWKAIRRKVPKLKLYLNRRRRYQFASPFSKPKRSIIPKFLLHW